MAGARGGWRDAGSRARPDSLVVRRARGAGAWAACSESDPAALATFEVLLNGEAMEHSFVMACTVDAVTTKTGQSITSLACDDAGVPITVTLTLPAAPEGEVAWTVGEMLALHSRSENFEVYSEMEFQLRGLDDDKLWAAGLAPRVGPFIPQIFEPIAVEPVTACGPVGAEDLGSSYQLDFELAGQPPLSLFSGHRGALAIDAAESFAVDVESALYNDCCHATESFTVLVRRVKTG